MLFCYSVLRKCTHWPSLSAKPRHLSPISPYDRPITLYHFVYHTSPHCLAYATLCLAPHCVAPCWLASIAWSVNLTQTVTIMSHIAPCPMLHCCTRPCFHNRLYKIYITTFHITTFHISTSHIPTFQHYPSGPICSGPVQNTSTFDHKLPNHDAAGELLPMYMICSSHLSEFLIV